MTIYLLDTNTVSDAIRHRDAVLTRLSCISPAAMRISALTVGELNFGVAMRPDAKRLAIAVSEFLRRIEVVSWGREAAQAHGSLRARLQRAGRRLAPMDMLIAAQAISLDATLVTADRAFRSVTDLAVENWGEVG